MDDQHLIPRLRSLKHFFFLSQASFLTHFMDLGSSELRKPAKGISLVKLQSLLDLSLNSGESFSYKEDVKVTMATSGLYEWLLKVVSVSGALGGDAEELAGGIGAASVGALSTVDHADETGKEKDKNKKDLQGVIPRLWSATFADSFCEALTLSRWIIPSASRSPSSSHARRFFDTSSSFGSFFILNTSNKCSRQCGSITRLPTGVWGRRNTQSLISGVYECLCSVRVCWRLCSRFWHLRPSRYSSRIGESSRRSSTRSPLWINS